MRLGVSITAFNEKNIAAIIKQYDGVADKVVVAVSSKPWYGVNRAGLTALNALLTGALMKFDYWKTEAEQRNWTMEQLQDCDYIIVSHCDTFFTKEDLRNIKLRLSTATDRNYTCTVLTYWKDFDTVIEPNIGLPTLFVRRDAHFTQAVNIEDQLANPRVLDAICHHLSWVKTDEEVQEKITSYHHAPEVKEDWFEKVWKKWTPDMLNFAPTNPSDYQTVRKESLPEEIRKKL